MSPSDIPFQYLAVIRQIDPGHKTTLVPFDSSVLTLKTSRSSANVFVVWK